MLETVAPSHASNAAEFRMRGFVVLRRALVPEAVQGITRQLEVLSGRVHAHSRRRRLPLLPTRGVAGAWTLPDGVSKRPEFWGLLFEDRILEAVREVLGPDACFLQHTDLHVGFSAVGWHRDCVNRSHGVGPDWDESVEPYRLVRVGIYLQSFSESGFRLGLIPETHRSWPTRREDASAAIESRTRGLWSAATFVTGRSPLDDLATWLPLEQGDAILFDPRILHAGKEAHGPKFSVFLAYGAPSGHFHRHADYYRRLRPELGYEDLPSHLVRRLKDAGLYAAERATSSTRDAAAWQPPAWQVGLGRRVRAR